MHGQPNIIKSISLISISLLVLSSQSLANQQLSIFVSMLPQKFFVQKIVGQSIPVHVIIPKGHNPVTYGPKPSQITELSHAQLYFAIGVPFESIWLPKFKALNPKMHIVHTEYYIKKVAMQSHAHEKSHKQHDTTLDPHIWLSPPLVMLQARHILMAVSNLVPSQHSLFESNYQAFINELAALDIELMALFKGFSNRTIMVFHPAWGYFCKAYHLNQMPVEIEGKEPKPMALKKLIDYSQSNQIKTLFVQPQFSQKSAQVIAESIQGQVVEIDPLSEDWTNNMRNTAIKIQQSLKMTNQP